MTRRLRLGNAYGVESAIDSTSVVSPILAASALGTVAGHALPSASVVAAMVASVAAAIGVFASLAVREVGLPRPAGAAVPVGGPAIGLLLSSGGAATRAAAITKQRGVTTTGRSHRGALET